MKREIHICPECLDNTQIIVRDDKGYCKGCNSTWTIEVEETKPQVDFDLLTKFNDNYLEDNYFNLEKTHRKNLKLFFQMMSKSSKFAHKAHKKLKKLI